MNKYLAIGLLLISAFMLIGCGQYTPQQPPEDEAAFNGIDVESSESPFIYGSPKILLDSSGNPMIVYLRKISSTESDIKLAIKSSSAWAISTIFSPITGYDYRSHGLAAKTDGSGNLHVLFGNGEPVGQLYHLYQSGGSWIAETIATNVRRPDYNNFDLAIDNSDIFHAIFQDATTSNYFHATKEASGAWILNQIPSAEGSSYGAYEVSLRLDQLNRPHIIYANTVSSNAKKLCHAHFNGSIWENEEMFNIEGSGEWDFIIDPNNYPQIAYYYQYDSGGGYIYYKIYYTYKNGTDWTLELIDRSVMLNGPICISSNSSGQPCLVYGATDPSHLSRYAVKTSSGTWNKYLIKSNIFGPLGTSLILDSTDKPHISSTNYSAPDALQYYYLK